MRLDNEVVQRSTYDQNFISADESYAPSARYLYNFRSFTENDAISNCTSWKYVDFNTLNSKIDYILLLVNKFKFRLQLGAIHCKQA